MVELGVAEEMVNLVLPPLVPNPKPQDQPDSGAPSTQTFQQGTGKGVDYISGGGARLIFVRNLQRVHGRISLLQSQRNIENLTNLANH